MCKCGPGKGPIIGVLVTSVICLLLTIPPLFFPWGFYVFELDIKTVNDDSHFNILSFSEITQNYLFAGEEESLKYPGAGTNCDDDLLDDDDDKAIKLKRNDDSDDKCNKEGVKKYNYDDYINDDVLKEVDDDALGNLHPRAQAAQAFDALMLILSFCGIVYCSIALCKQERHQFVEKGLAASMFVISVCAFLTSGLFSSTIGTLYGNIESDIHSDLLYNNTNPNIDVDEDNAYWQCTLGCELSFAAAAVQVTCSIVWLVFAGTCKPALFVNTAEPGIDDGMKV